MEIRLLVSKEIDEMEDTLYLDSLHIKDEYKDVSVSIMNSNNRARNLYTKLGVILFNDEKIVEKKSKYREIVEKNLDK